MVCQILEFLNTFSTFVMYILFSVNRREINESNWFIFQSQLISWLWLGTSQYKVQILPMLEDSWCRQYPPKKRCFCILHMLSFYIFRTVFLRRSSLHLPLKSTNQTISRTSTLAKCRFLQIIYIIFYLEIARPERWTYTKKMGFNCSWITYKSQFCAFLTFINNFLSDFYKVCF